MASQRMKNTDIIQLQGPLATSTSIASVATAAAPPQQPPPQHSQPSGGAHTNNGTRSNENNDNSNHTNTVVMGAVGVREIRKRFSAPDADPMQVVTAFQQEFGTYPSAVANAGVEFLDVLGVSRLDTHGSVVSALREHLLGAIPTLHQDTLQTLLEASFPYVAFPDLRIVPITVMQTLKTVNFHYLDRLRADPELMQSLPLTVRRQVWEQFVSVFESTIRPLLAQYVDSEQCVQALHTFFPDDDKFFVDLEDGMAATAAAANGKHVAASSMAPKAAAEGIERRVVSGSSTRSSSALGGGVAATSLSEAAGLTSFSVAKKKKQAPSDKSRKRSRPAGMAHFAAIELQRQRRPMVTLTTATEQGRLLQQRTPQRRRQEDSLLQNIISLIGDSTVLYQVTLRLVRAMYIETSNDGYCVLRLDVLMAFHDMGRAGKPIADIDTAHQFAWCLDAACGATTFMRMDERHRTKLAAFIRAVPLKHPVLGEFALLVRHPSVRNVLLASIIAALRSVVDAEGVPCKDKALRFLVALYRLGEGAHKMLVSTTYTRPAVSSQVLGDFLPLIAEMIVLNELEESQAVPSQMYPLVRGNVLMRRLLFYFTVDCVRRRERDLAMALCDFWGGLFVRGDGMDEQGGESNAGAVDLMNAKGGTCQHGGVSEIQGGDLPFFSALITQLIGAILASDTFRDATIKRLILIEFLVPVACHIPRVHGEVLRLLLLTYTALGVDTMIPLLARLSSEGAMPLGTSTSAHDAKLSGHIEKMRARLLKLYPM